MAESGSNAPLSAYLTGRSAVLAVLMPVASIEMWRWQGARHPSFRWFFAVTAASYAFSLITALFARSRKTGRRTGAAQTLWDIAYCTAVLYLSGGFFSPFVFLYLLAIIGAAYLFSRSGALAAAVVSGVFYLTLAVAQFEGAIRPLNPFLVSMDTGPGLAVRIGFHVLAFFAVAALAGYLTEELRRAGEKLVQARDEILDLEHLQAAILQSMGSGLMAIDEADRVMFCNQSAENLLRKAGMTPESHKTLFRLTDSDRTEVRLPAADGEMVIGYSVFPLADRTGRRRGRILTFQDLTTIRKLEKGLIAADRMAAVGRLAAGLAHEVRNPLASLSGSVQLLQRLSSGDSGGEQDQLFNIVVRETDRLNHLVSDFLGYARPAEVRATRFLLAELLREVDVFFRQGEGREGFDLAADVPADVAMVGDREQIEALLLNLFRNSIEAGGGKARVTVRAGIEGGELVLDVADDGPGIPADIAERAFEPFVSSKAGGTGLGLATVHRIVENHGGKVGFENRKEGGVAFHMRFPVRAGG